MSRPVESDHGQDNEETQQETPNSIWTQCKAQKKVDKTMENILRATRTTETKTHQIAVRKDAKHEEWNSLSIQLFNLFKSSTRNMEG
ncbi:MAG: hypothetical protein HRU26_15675 [Psychroserpens sp.]|nr:hypothetical protein [Psychroserpens sp.]